MTSYLIFVYKQLAIFQLETDLYQLFKNLYRYFQNFSPIFGYWIVANILLSIDTEN